MVIGNVGKLAVRTAALAPLLLGTNFLKPEASKAFTPQKNTEPGIELTNVRSVNGQKLAQLQLNGFLIELANPNNGDAIKFGYIRQGSRIRAGFYDNRGGIIRFQHRNRSFDYLTIVKRNFGGYDLPCFDMPYGNGTRTVVIIEQSLTVNVGNQSYSYEPGYYIPHYNTRGQAEYLTKLENNTLLSEYSFLNQTLGAPPVNTTLGRPPVQTTVPTTNNNCQAYCNLPVSRYFGQIIRVRNIQEARNFVRNNFGPLAGNVHNLDGFLPVHGLGRIGGVVIDGNRTDFRGVYQGTSNASTVLFTESGRNEYFNIPQQGTSVLKAYSNTGAFLGEITFILESP